MSSRIPHVSVIIPCFNQGRYLREAVYSVLEQSFSDFECLIIDDGSIDETADVLQSLCREDKQRIKMLRHSNGENRGLAASRNLGIEAARGEYIGILDADDAWLPDKLERQLSVFQQFPDVGLVYGQAVNVPQSDPRKRMEDCNREQYFVQGDIRENNGENQGKRTWISPNLATFR